MWNSLNPKPNSLPGCPASMGTWFVTVFTIFSEPERPLSFLCRAHTYRQWTCFLSKFQNTNCLIIISVNYKTHLHLTYLSLNFNTFKYCPPTFLWARSFYTLFHWPRGMSDGPGGYLEVSWYQSLMVTFIWEEGDSKWDQLWSAIWEQLEAYWFRGGNYVLYSGKYDNKPFPQAMGHSANLLRKISLDASRDSKTHLLEVSQLSSKADLPFRN